MRSRFTSSCLVTVLIGSVVALAGQAPPARGGTGAPAIRFVPGGTTKVEQLLGEEDKERHQPTLSRTVTRYGLEGTDLGSSFEHNGRVYFLFGDTVGTLAHALDSIGVTDAKDPDAGVRLDFLTSDAPAPARRGGGARRGGRAGQPPAGSQQYLTIQPPGISMGPFEVPAAGISLNGQMYVVVTTNHSDDRTTDRSVLTKFTLPSKFTAGRTISQLPEGRFVKMSLRLAPAAVAGLPAGGPYVLMWGSGQVRKSEAYLAIVPAAHFEDGKGTRYFAGLDAGTPRWSEKESDAVALTRNGTIGDVSVTWCAPLGLWLMTYDSRPPATRGILFQYSATPWGPWSDPQLIFDGTRDGGFGRFMHDPRGNPPDTLVGPVIGRGTENPAGVRGGEYAPYVVERWTKVGNGELTIYYTLSTWNPYVVVLMRTTLRVGS